MNHSQEQEALSELYEDSLEEGYEICNKCDGTGKIHYENWGTHICDKCWGEGKLDWIENIIGKEVPYRSVSGSSSSLSSTQNSSLPTQKAVKPYIESVNNVKGRNYDNKNIFRSRTVQRFYKMFNKSKRGM